MEILVALREYEHGYPDWRQPCRYINFLTALREYQLGYPDWKQRYRYVFETLHCYLRETGTLMLHSCVGHGRCNMQHEEDVLDIAHNDPSSSSHQIFSAIGV
jgi:hypothetical protein